MKTQKTVPQKTIMYLSFAEAELMSYMVNKKDRIGCLYTDKKKSRRYAALKKLIEKDIFFIFKKERNIIWFKLKKDFTRIKPDNEHTVQYIISEISINKPQQILNHCTFSDFQIGLCA